MTEQHASLRQAPAATGPALDSTRRRGSRRPGSVAVAVAVVLLLLGVLGSVLAGAGVARSDATSSRRAFRAGSGQIASTLQLAIQHEQDLVVAAKGFFVGDPTASQAQFRQWAHAVGVAGRYPELATLGSAVIVPASGVPSFAARVSPRGRFTITPPGRRPFYCFVADEVRTANLAALPTPPGLDFCATPAEAAIGLGARDSGNAAYVPESSGRIEVLVVFTPVYRGGGIPATVAARRAAFIGWVWTVATPLTLLERALQGHPQTAVTFRYENGAGGVTFQSGSAPRGARTSPVDLHNGWTVETSAAVAGGSVFADTNALTLLIAGIALSGLLAALAFVLGTGRERALRLVAQRTGELRYQALHDGLTGLPNRTLITDRIEQLLARNRRARTSGAALYVDLDEFKNVNDSLGHEAGDRLLVAVAARLTGALREADTIGRMGGDEFVVLIDGGELEIAPELVAQRLLEVMRQPFEVDAAAMPLIINTSIGIAVGNRDSAGELLRDADVALYQAKAAGKNRYQTFNAALETQSSDRMELEFELRSALEGEQFRLVYQPIYNLDDLALVGVEALLRWQHPARGLVQPATFIPILEQTGQIREVGRWVLHKACEQMAAWHARGDTLDVSVNVSAAQLDSDAIVDHIRGALMISGLDAASLIIEVTETALMRNADATARRLHAIKALGVRIAVDDFGTGYSSLAYLQQFPVDCLKIDRMFTSAITSSPESKALIGTLVQLGKDLGLKTLAEGVETPGQLDHLRGDEVDEIQGFLLSRPLDPETLEDQILAPIRAAGSPASHLLP